MGLVAGWLAGQIVRGTGDGLIADIAIGIVGALIGAWLLPQLGIIRAAASLPPSSRLPSAHYSCCLFFALPTGQRDGERAVRATELTALSIARPMTSPSCVVVSALISVASS